MLATGEHANDVMTINDIQNLIDLLGESPTIAELAVTAPDGSEIAIKRRISIASAAAGSARAATAVESASEPVPLAAEPNTVMSAVASTMVGVFHASVPPLTLGATVSAGQRVGFIESIKLMNEVVSTATGTVVEVLIADGQPVEYGQVLYQVRPDPSPSIPMLGAEDSSEEGV